MNRSRFNWKCVLQCEDGSTKERLFSSFWSPEKDFITSGSIASSAAATESQRSGKKYVGISAQLQPTV